MTVSSCHQNRFILLNLTSDHHLLLSHHSRLNFDLLPVKFNQVTTTSPSHSINCQINFLETTDTFLYSKINLLSNIRPKDDHPDCNR